MSLSFAGDPRSGQRAVGGEARRQLPGTGRERWSELAARRRAPGGDQGTPSAIERQTANAWSMRAARGLSDMARSARTPMLMLRRTGTGASAG